MKAALYQGQGKIEMTTLPDPVCTDDGVILQNIYASICGTDVAVYTHGTGLGHKITIGGEFGHEVVCRIKEKGKNTKDAPSICTYHVTNKNIAPSKITDRL